MKIYISGKISGMDESEARKLFAAAFIQLQDWNHEPVDPMTLPHDHGRTWLEFMREDIKALMDCEAIYMLENWTESQGAKIELSLAASLGMKIIFQ